MKKIDWILCSQRAEDLKKYAPGSILWINHCLRCGKEEPVAPGPVDQILKESKRFIDLHSKSKKS